MSFQYLLILIILFSMMFLLIQRAEPRRRIVVSVILIIPALLIRNFIVYREIQTEGWLAIFVALFLNLLFWITIGRYNPVASSDEIQVLGMDD